MKSSSLLLLICLVLALQVNGANAAEREALAYTDYTENSELFVEFKVLVVGEASSFAAHLTKLADFKALTEGKVIVTLSGGGQADENFEAGPSENPGIFRPVVKPVHAGERQVSVTVQTPKLNSVHRLGPVQVYPDLQSAPKAKEEAKAPGEISFLKEQQWQVAFATSVVQRKTLRASLPATGVLHAPSNAETTLTAPSAGIVIFPEQMPVVGHEVARGQLLASIVPRLAERGDMASLSEEARKTQLRHDLAHKEHDRAKMLLDSGVMAERQTLTAQTTHELTHAEMEAAQKRLNQYRQPAGASGSAIPLKAPLAGIIAQSFVSNGRYVESGEKLFQVVDRNRLWLEARVPEADSAQLTQISGAAFKVDGFDEIFEINPGENGRLVSLATVIDPVHRTLPVIFELDRPDPRLPLESFARVRLFTGQATEALAVPESALVDDNGLSVAFVQTGGESFERRLIKLGVRDAGFVEVKDGLAPTDRVVSQGAYLVYLAATAPGAAVHGHVH
ncbi:efflux RND transporter periplasmic adaptor subunit [Methylomonas sp. LL1]|uniref:efflux RND transporter periplasmic adaptor subunit n=1 Tax=Methylomonas sp. LL1 TaxID=2785785 RepID=UPI0018C3E310|nr:efflux RND transporter periplasmic adaptor subunit [Methylomonas sp. LL1]QPK61650.1 efflux RND transporter periplasmic adaptor subunit [Methylomonas sp. LL1]